MPTKQEKRFIQGYEVFGVSPLPHYFEEIYAQTIGLPSLGLRGDQNYFWYSKDGMGTAYYELSEQQKSAESAFAFFQKARRFRQYVKSIKKTIRKINGWIEQTDQLNLTNINTKQLFEYAYQSWMLDAEIFSYYLVSQPYRMQLFEDRVKAELKKRVAASRIDDYLARLTTSGQTSMTSEEEMAWAKLQVFAKTKYPNLDKASLSENKKLLKKILNHYNKFKVLTLGDGNWDFDPNTEVKRFLEDNKKPLEDFRKTIIHLKQQPKELLKQRKQLEKDLRLSPATIKVIDFLAAMSHIRYSMRVEGFIPLLKAITKVFDELSPRLGFTKEGDMPYLTHEEFEASKKLGKLSVSINEITKRRSKHNEYLILLDDGKIKYFYGSQAGKLQKKLLPHVDHGSMTELTGTTAVTGVIRGSVCVYQWGDDISTKISQIKSNPILITGQTRPSMMPIIRLAKGIVTDEGGITSHAAIVSRELGIPSVIGTVHATKVFKDGDVVELDANSGVIRKIT